MTDVFPCKFMDTSTMVNEGFPNYAEFPNNVSVEGMCKCALPPDLGWISNMPSEELNRLIDMDNAEFIASGDCPTPDILAALDDLNSEITASPRKVISSLAYPDDELDILTGIMVNPRTGSPVKYPFMHPSSADMEVQVQPREPPKPYHPSQDHDYLGFTEEISPVDKLLEAVDELLVDGEIVVDVWGIDNFLHNDSPPAPVIPKSISSAYTICKKEPTICKKETTICKKETTICKKETRRTSTRTTEIKRREHAARNISNAVHAVLKKDNTQRRQYKNNRPNKRPKNSVETTPSQSDIEEWYSQPAKPTKKVTKKKTSKGRIDHSESERHRREVLRTNFSFLSDLVPQKYLRGEKMSSQISKQKILNGAKAFLLTMRSRKGKYKGSRGRNGSLRDECQKIVFKVCKYLKRRK